MQLCLSGPCFNGPALMLPWNVLNGHSPRLRELDLHGVLITWSAPMLQNLTHLSVKSYIRDAEARMDLSTTDSQHSHLIEALQKMPALETLSLEYCLPPRFPSPVSNQVVDLPCLNKLYLYDTSDWCTAVLKKLRVPSSCCLGLGMNGPANIHDILPFLCAYVANVHGEAPFLTLAITFDHENFTVGLWRTYLEADRENSFQRPLDPHVRFQFIRPGHPSDLVQILCRALPLESLRRLSIYASHPAWTSQNWIDTFGQCTVLESVLLDGRNAVHYCGGLLQPDHAPLLNLRSLWLTDLNFHDDIVHGSGGISVFHRAFLAWLTARKEMGPLFKLVIKECHVKETYITELRQILEVKWK